jgi:signal transduction histidine kinase
MPVESRGRLLELWTALAGLYLVTTYLATSITARLREKEDALSRSERSLEVSYHGMASLYEVGQLVNSTLDVNEVLDLIGRHATWLLNARAASIRLLDATGQTLTIGGSFGLSRSYLDKGPVDVENSLVDAEALRGRIVQVPEVADDPRFQYPGDARREGLRSMVTCPMRARHRTLGVIRVYTAEPHDFTEQEQQLLMNLANLGAVAIENARDYSNLRALDQERVWFARTTHHQLRSPLAAVQSAIDALAFAGPLNAAQQDLVLRARRRIQDAFDTIRDLLDLAAVQRVAPAAVEEPVSFGDALARLLESTRERCAAKGLEFVVDVPPASCRVRIAAGDLERIFGNLLDNAVKYTRCGRVALTARCASGGWLDVAVEDTGIGIEPGARARIFDAFFRSAAAKATSEMGTGLGLSIVEKLVTRLGGTIAVESEAGHGTRFVVRLPGLAPAAA